jgi:hypothetical protein
MIEAPLSVREVVSGMAAIVPAGRRFELNKTAEPGAGR